MLSLWDLMMELGHLTDIISSSTGSVEVNLLIYFIADLLVAIIAVLVLIVVSCDSDSCERANEQFAALQEVTENPSML